MVSRCGVLVAASLWLLAAITPAWPQAPQQPASQPSLGLQQQAQPPAQPPPPDQPAPQATPENPGLIHEMGKLFDKMMPSMKSPSDTIGDINARARDAAKDAGDTLSRLKPGIPVSGRTICPPAADRTPDCQVAANFLCQGKGYKEGKSLNTDSAESCSAKVLIPGRQRKPDDCKTNTYVTTALCQ
jgi:hypothetical protein